MAKSFYNIIEEGSISVSHRGEDVTLQLPSWLCDADGLLEDANALLEWANENKIVHALLHSGIQQMIIQMRAVARPKVNVKTDESLSIISDRENAQKRLYEFEMKPVAKPGQRKDTMTEDDMFKALKAAGYTVEEIIAKLNP